MSTSEQPMPSSTHVNGHPLLHMFSMDAAKATLQEPIDAEVKGNIPRWLKGSLYRNGAGIYKMGDTVWKHLFDGFAVLHRWTIQDGRVTYLATTLDSDHFKKSFAVNRLVGGNFGTSFPDPCKSIFRRFFSHFLPLPPIPSDNTAVNIVEMGDRLFAITEHPFINEVDPKTMLCTDKTFITDYLAVHIGTAHPHFEKDGTVLYYGTNVNYKKAYNIIQAPPIKDNEKPFVNGKIIASIPSRWKFNIGYNHSFGMSENYVVVLEQPYAINIWKTLIADIRKQTMADCIETFPDENLLIHVVEKKTGKQVPITYKAPRGFVFHFINCYEDSGHLICDVCLLDTLETKHFFFESLIHNGWSLGTANFARFVLPLNIDEASIGDNVNFLSGSQAKAIVVGDSIVEVAAEMTFGTDLPFELPRINYEAVNGVKYRYVYGSTFFNGQSRKKVLKLDLENKTVKEWKCEDNYEPAEPVFIPHPDATLEDEGVILCPIISTVAENKSFLLILDASTFQELAIASLPAEITMNITFHGTFSSKVFES